MLKIFLLGKLKNGVNIVILDEDKNVLPESQIGEILIVGDSVADGYLGDVNKTAFIEYNGEKAYLTGDLGYLENGVLFYKCRKDKQIKYKGYRIELFDIEKNLYDLGYIEKAVVIPRKNQYGKITQIIAFVKLKGDFFKSELDIRKDLESRIPEYMCPKIRIVEEFPLNKNGKCDEKRLLEEY